VSRVEILARYAAHVVLVLFNGIGFADLIWDEVEGDHKVSIGAAHRACPYHPAGSVGGRPPSPDTFQTKHVIAAIENTEFSSLFESVLKTNRTYLVVLGYTLPHMSCCMARVGRVYAIAMTQLTFQSMHITAGLAVSTRGC